MIIKAEIKEGHLTPPSNDNRGPVPPASSRAIDKTRPGDDRQARADLAMMFGGFGI